MFTVEIGGLTLAVDTWQRAEFGYSLQVLGLHFMIAKANLPGKTRRRAEIHFKSASNFSNKPSLHDLLDPHFADRNPERKL
jgi:hypothetical protein